MEISLYEKKLSVTQVIIENTSGSPYVQEELVYEQGFFGNVTDPDGIADGATGVIDINSERVLETKQINTADTFAESTDDEPAEVFFDTVNKELRDSLVTDSIPVGQLVKGGAKDSNNVIGFKPYFQTTNNGSVPANSISFTELEENVLKKAVIEISATEIKTLRATPKELIPAPGVGKLILMEHALVKFTAGSEVLTESSDNLAIKYDDGVATSAVHSLETTDFIDQTVDMIERSISVSGTISIDEYANVVNKNVSIFNDGDSEFAGNASNDAALTVTVIYRILSV